MTSIGVKHSLFHGRGEQSEAGFSPRVILRPLSTKGQWRHSRLKKVARKSAGLLMRALVLGFVCGWDWPRADHQRKPSVASAVASPAGDRQARPWGEQAIRGQLSSPRRFWINTCLAEIALTAFA